MTPGASIHLATGDHLDAVGWRWGVIRLPAEPDEDFRARLLAHIRALNAPRTREWMLT